MSALIDKTVNILLKLDEDNKSIIFDFARFIEQKQNAEKEARNAAYLDKIQRGIDQCAEGRGLKRDIIEVPDDE